jgi:hypothetical protein
VVRVTIERLLRLARPIAIVLAAALLVDLFLTWRDASIVAGPVDVDAGASGWGGWGAIAGVFIVVLLVWEVASTLTSRFDARIVELVGGILCVAVGGLAVVAFFTGSADVDVAGVVSVVVDERQWAAYVGLILGLALGAAGALRLFALASHTTLTTHRPHHGVA